MTEISKQYNPKETEDRCLRFWEEQDLFQSSVNPAHKPFCIVIPPPNVTGILHMGHALNNTIQDILIRYHRMKGEEALWMPGTDHAGIATQNVVEKSIAQEGLKRQDLGREKFIERVWQWREQYGSTIIRQLKKLGASCDWQRTRFTMDEEYSRAVTEVFIRLYKKGLIYQGSYIINWCPRCQTALSDEEAPHRELQGNLYYLKYPFSAKGGSASGGKDKDYIVVATTRPETMLGDTAVAVNPKDKRYQKLVGKILVLPLINREIRIIADSMVDRKFGTGAVKVTPAHDPNDYALGRKHKLEFVNVMHPDGRMNENAGEYREMDRFEAREVILEDLKEQGLLERIEPHALSAGHCYRCHTIIEPYLSKQWFVKMKPLARPAIAAVKRGKIKFYPSRWTKVYLNWMENIQDWCISRQIWWGHRLPVYYCKNCQAGSKSRITNPKSQTNPKQKIGIIVSRIKPDKCSECGSADIYQDEDVLDTWFSSWLWPFATFGWPDLNEQSKKELGYFYPTSVLVTAPEIIFFWVARMIMAGLEFMKDIPFRDVYIHGTVRDIEGKKMSKSLGNIIDPLDIINEYGADALRFSLIAITAQGQDVFLSKERFEQGRNFANKIWNATRLVLMNLKKMPNADLCQIFQKRKPACRQAGLALPERWILSRFYTTLSKVNAGLENYRFNEVAKLLYEFIWHEFCDWYLEIIKDRFSDQNTRLVVYKVLEKSLRLLHPIMPFITEELWQTINPKADSITMSPWPHLQRQMVDKKSEGQMKAIIELVTAVRNIRCEWGIDPFKNIDLILKVDGLKDRSLLEENSNLIKRLIKIHKLSIAQRITLPEKCATGVVGRVDFFVPLTEIINVDKEKSRLEQQIGQLDKLLVDLKSRLKNKDFLMRAPSEIVEKEKAKKRELTEKIDKLKKAIKSLA